MDQHVPNLSMNMNKPGPAANYTKENLPDATIFIYNKVRWPACRKPTTSLGTNNLVFRRIPSHPLPNMEGSHDGKLSCIFNNFWCQCPPCPSSWTAAIFVFFDEVSNSRALRRTSTLEQRYHQYVTKLPNRSRTTSAAITIMYMSWNQDWNGNSCSIRCRISSVWETDDRLVIKELFYHPIITSRSLLFYKLGIHLLHWELCTLLHPAIMINW